MDEYEIEKLCRDQHAALTKLIGNDDDYTDREREVQADAYLDIANVISDARRRASELGIEVVAK